MRQKPLDEFKTCDFVVLWARDPVSGGYAIWHKAMILEIKGIFIKYAWTQGEKAGEATLDFTKLGYDWILMHEKDN